MSKQSRRFRVTLFRGEKPSMSAELMTYLAGQQETCPDTGRLHWQLYLETRVKSTATLKRTGQGLANALAALWEVDAVDTRIADYPEQAKAYVRKPDSAVEGTYFEEGSALRTTGSPQEIAEQILGGATPLEVIERNPANLMYLRSAMALASMKKPAFDERTMKFDFIWGVPGSGKSHLARQIMAKAGFSSPHIPTCYQNGYFLGPFDHAQVLYLEDLTPKDIPRSVLLKLCDKWVGIFNVKNGQAYSVYTHIIITSNFPPQAFDDETGAFQDRIRRFGSSTHLSERFLPANSPTQLAPAPSFTSGASEDGLGDQER